MNLKLTVKKLYYSIRGWDYLQNKIRKYRSMSERGHRFTLREIDDIFDVGEAIIYKLRMSGDNKAADEFVSDVHRIVGKER